jgi:hypothetical protein
MGTYFNNPEEIKLLLNQQNVIFAELSEPNKTEISNYIFNKNFKHLIETLDSNILNKAMGLIYKKFVIDQGIDANIIFGSISAVEYAARAYSTLVAIGAGGGAGGGAGAGTSMGPSGLLKIIKSNNSNDFYYKKYLKYKEKYINLKLNN